MARIGGAPRVAIVVVGGLELPLRVAAPNGGRDLAIVDGLLRLRLAARRRGWSLRVTEVDEELHELIQLVGVGDSLGLPPAPPLRSADPG